MKTLSMLKENGYDNITKGVTNHLTPVENIITNVRNFFGDKLSMVVTKGEDNVSIKCTSSLWTNEENARSAMYWPAWNDRTSLYSYVSMQGLSCVKMIPVGQDIVVYFCPSDIQNSFGYGGEDDYCEPKSLACTEQRNYHLGDVEYNQFGEIKEDAWQPEQEIEDVQKKDIRELLAIKDKVKAAKAFADILGQNMRMPENYYIKAVRDEDGNESVALRYRYEKRKPFGKTATMTKTLVNIYGLGDNGIWVDGADDPNGLPEEMKGVIDDMLGFIGVRRTGDACCFTIAEDPDTADDLNADPNDINNKDNDNDNQDNSEGENDNDVDSQQKKEDDNKTTMDNTPSNSESGFSRNDGMKM